MSVSTAALNQQIAGCADALQSGRRQRRHLQTRLLQRLQTPLLLGGIVLLGVWICSPRAAEPSVSTATPHQRTWLQRLPFWGFALWQAWQRAPEH